jgi:hypothetical protein
MTTIDLVSAEPRNLPVVLTPGAWQEAVHIQDPVHT